MKTEIQLFISDETQMHELGAQMVKHIKPGTVIFLQGSLGAGKTTLVRGFLRGLHYEGAVRSPTFTIVESYNIESTRIHHFDFYRLNHIEEAEYLGLADYFDNEAICFVEWPEHALSLLPQPTLCCTITVPERGRILHWVADKDEGIQFLKKMKHSWTGKELSL